MNSVLFVCTANICRSPLAMGLWQNMVSGQIGDWQIDSAGTWTIAGEPPARNSVHVLQARGIDIREYRSKPVTSELLDSFNLILTMERGHKEALRVEFQNLASRIFLLSEMIEQKFDIEDPIGGPVEEFENTALEIEQILQRGYNKIVLLSSGDTVK